MCFDDFGESITRTCCGGEPELEVYVIGCVCVCVSVYMCAPVCKYVLLFVCVCS